MHGDMGAWGWAMMVVGPLVWIAVPALVAWVAWVGGRPRRDETPLDVLKGTYARGQITRDQYEQIKRDLA